MLKEQANLFKKMTILSDLLLVFGSFLLAYQIRAEMPGGLNHFYDYVWVLLFVFPVWYLSLSSCGLYESMRRLGFVEIFLRLFRAHIYCGLFLSALVLFLDRDQYSRGLILVFLLISLIVLTIHRLFSKYMLGRFRKRGFNLRHSLVVGTQEKAEEFISLLEDREDWGIRVSGFVQIVKGEVKDDFCGYKVLGKIENLIDICKDNLVDEVVFCIPKNHVVDVEAYLVELEKLGVTVRLVLDFYELSQYKTDLTVFDGRLPVLTFYTKSLDAQQLLLKRLLDIAGSFVGLFFLAISFPFIALAIKVEAPGPIFFCQERVGESGRKFFIWKFRSMFMDAEERKKDLLAQNEMNGAMFKIKNDPRITKVGRFLRKTSLDEFPQFWNVLSGEMSLVGTRPPTPAEVSEYDNWHRRRITMKPGITGMWQVSGRNDIVDFDEIVKLDLAYIDTWNIWLDVKILLKTVKVVFSRGGSY